MDVWFSATQAKCEVVFEMKLSLYADACASLTTRAGDIAYQRQQVKEEEAATGSKDVQLLASMLLTKPLKVPKTAGFVDAVEQQLHAVYGELEDGYTLHDDDKVALERAGSSRGTPLDIDVAASQADANGNPLLYGELTPKGTRQLHDVVMQCVARAGVVALSGGRPTHLEEGEKDTESIEREAAAAAATGGNARQCYHHSLVAIDVGSGTGKLLFEWSLLAWRDAAPYRCCWTHVGLELVPSRMRIARRALPHSAALVRGRVEQPQQDCCWVVNPPSDGAGDGRVVLGEADAFAPGLLTNETFRPVADAMLGRAASGDKHDSNSTPCHLVVFCCGLGFVEPAVRELCAALERMWQAPYAPHSSPWRTMTCVLLLRPFDGLRTFPLFRLCTDAAAGGKHDASAGSLSTALLETTWMSEAPAWVLSFRAE
ncbi:hypothetical protein DQ04_01691060 [Trypanosoma grayi]|uniref:hypothetical protein n=1 Tax=Trypanosoma grayi TaxID=71804 RepID=UPI0004F4306C|nr:hypothetical protein DQ04_01691060 [Trypanosoma grayi]KEG12468.1 hypothetical protein DQ04_01691060 [Trypanosoma grayi]